MTEGYNIDLGQGETKPLRLQPINAPEGTASSDLRRKRRDTDKATHLFDVRLAMMAIAMVLLIGSLICLIISLIALI